MSSSYATAMDALARDRIVICTPGIDRSDGETVVCTSSWVMAPHDGIYFKHRDPFVRVTYLLAIARVAHEDLRDRHGIECA